MKKEKTEVTKETKQENNNYVTQVTLTKEQKKKLKIIEAVTDQPLKKILQLAIQNYIIANEVKF